MKKSAVLVFVFLSFFLSSCSQEAPEFKQLLVYPKKNPLPEFKLTHHSGSEFTKKSFKGKWNLIFIGYTHCPDVCPNTLTDIDKFYSKIPAELQSKFQVILFSVDPKRDTQKHLASYISHFNDDFMAMTGEKSEIDKLVKALGGIYTINSESEEYYTVDHSGRIFIVNPQAERFGIISSEAMHSKDKTLLVEDLTALSKLN